MTTCNVFVHKNQGIKAGVVLLVIFLFLFVLPLNTVSASERMFGNIDGGEDINVNDVVVVMRYVLGLETLDADQREAADVNNDGKVNVSDVVLIMQYALELIDEFPAELVTTDTFITVNPNHDSIDGHNWPSEETVTVTVNGDEFSVDTDEDGNFNMGWGDYPELEVERGQTVIATGGDIKKVHIVRDLHVTAIDSEEDMVSGTAPAGNIVEVRVFDMEVDYLEMPSRTVVAGSDGKWAADFSEAVGDEPYESAFDIAEGVTGDARIIDLTGDTTMLYWHYDETNFAVYVIEDTIRGYGWAPGAAINITVGDDEYDLTADNHGFFDADVEVSAGDSVEVTDGITAKNHLVTALQVIEADRDTGLIAGTADPESTVFIELLEPAGFDGPPTLVDDADVEADSDGDWSIDFDQELAENIVIYVFQEDDDGDRTVIIAPGIAVGSIEYESHTNDSITFLVKDAEGNPYDGTGAGAITLREEADKGLTDYVVIRADEVEWEPNIDSDGYATITYSDLEHKNVEGYVMPFIEYFQVTIETSDGKANLNIVMELECGGGFPDTWQDATIEAILFI